LKKRLSKCPNPSVGAKIPLTIGLALADGKEPELSPEIVHHLGICESCRQNVPLWYKKGQSARLTARAYSIVNRSSRGDVTIIWSDRRGADEITGSAPNERVDLEALKATKARRKGAER